MSDHVRLNELIDEYAQSTQFSRATLTELAQDVDDPEAFEWIVTGWMAGFRFDADAMC